MLDDHGLDQGDSTIKNLTITPLVQRFALTSATALVASCTGGRHVSVAAPTADRSFVAAIVDRVRETAGVPVDVDPQPLPDSLDGPGAMPTRATLDGDSPYALVRALIATAVRAAPPEERDHCLGLVLDDSLGSQHSGCPKNPHVLLVIGTPRRDTAQLLEMSRRGRVVPENHRWVRVLETEFYPGSRSVTVADHVLEPSNGGWRVVRRIELMVFD
jgi:hypothetical protein